MFLSHHKYFPPLIANTFYHIYNRGNNGENLFYRPENYGYFLQRFDHYLSDYLKLYAFCLLPNHFHLLVKVADADALPEEKRRLAPDTGQITPPDRIISEQFRRFFLGYSKSINAQEGRTGSLFAKPFKRKPVLSETYFTRLVYCIHANPAVHGIFDNFMKYPYSSYHRILDPKLTKLRKQEVLQWFGGRESYLDFHLHGAADGLADLRLED
jgi:REP element-mobilizing transposase RayT